MTVVVADNLAHDGVGGKGYVEFVLRFGTKELVAHAYCLALLLHVNRIYGREDGIG